MNANAQDIFAGVVAGVATAILCMGMATGSGLGILLFLLSPLPIMVVGLGWGVVAGLTGLVVACAGVALLGGLETSGFVLMTTALPAAMAALWLSLGRPASELGGPSDKTAWFPLSDVVFRLGLMTASAFILAGVMTGYGDEFATLVVDEMARRLQDQNPDFSFSPEGRADFIAAMTNFIPLMQPAMWLMVLVMNVYFALFITRKSGRLSRPQDVWPISLRMPRAAVITLAFAVAASFFGGTATLAANTVIGAMLAGFTLSGFAVLHANSMGKPWRPLALAIAYGGVLIAGFPVVIFTLIGLFNLARNMPVSDRSNPPGGSPPPLT